MTTCRHGSELLVPDWCPDHIAHKARALHELHRESPIAVGVIKRLTTDPRMRGIWVQLGKQSREGHKRTGKPLHKLADRFGGISHDDAVAGLFEFAVNIGRLTLELPSAHKPDHPFQALADRLKAEAKPLLGKDTASKKIAKLLLTVAASCEAVTLTTHNPEQNIARQIACWLEAVFGSPKYKLSAIIAGVITGREISNRKVRTLVGPRIGR